MESTDVRYFYENTLVTRDGQIYCFSDPGVHFVDEIKFMILLYKTSGCVADVQRRSARLPLRTRAVVLALAH